MKSIYRLIAILILLVNGFDISATQANQPFGIQVESKNIESISGSLTLELKIYILDSLTWGYPSFQEFPEFWQIQEQTNIQGQTFLPGDSIVYTINCTYPYANLPVYPIDLSFGFYTDSTATIITDCKIYFTPYNTIEVWNLPDFYDLPRRWLEKHEQTQQNRIYIAKDSIPISDIDIDFIKSIDYSKIDNDTLIFSELEVPGLAYSVLTMPNEDLKEIETAVKGLFTGRVEGTIRTDIINDLGEPVSIPLSGIRVKLMEYDALGFNHLVATVYSDENGFYEFDYSFSQLENKIELYVRFESITDSEFSVYSYNFFGVHHTRTPITFNIPKTGGVYVKNKVINFEESNYDAFRVVYWARNGYLFFKTNGIYLDPGLKININQIGSYNLPFKNIMLKNEAGDHENTIYHEFGHFAMYSMQDEFIYPCGTRLFGAGHYLIEENSIQLAYTEGWARAVLGILDAYYWEEDNEYGFTEGYIDGQNLSKKYPIAEVSRTVLSINNGIKSEWYIGSVIYDLWDGANHIPNAPDFIREYTNYEYHGWDDYTSSQFQWRLADDIEIDFNILCRPIIEHTGSQKLKNIGEYYNYLLSEIGNDYQLKSDISRAFRENHVLSNIEEYKQRGNINCMSSDDLLHNPSLIGDETVSCGSVAGFFHIDNINGRNGEAYNSYSYLAYPNKANVITEPVWLGSSYYNWQTEIKFNDISDGTNLQHGVFTTVNNIFIDIVDGQLEIGGTSTSAELTITDDSRLSVRPGTGSLVINNNSTLYIQSGASLVIEEFSDIIIKGNGKIMIEPGAFFCISPEANYTFETTEGIISFDGEVTFGLDPDLFWFINPTSSCGLFCGNTYLNQGNNSFSNIEFSEIESITYDRTFDNENLSFANNLTVKSGNTLTVKNASNLEFNAYNKIIIEPGAKLIVDGSTLTKGCVNIWGGIQIKGNKDILQTEANQGVLEVINGGLIEYARSAIYVGNSNEPWNDGGGIVRINNAVFRDNIGGIEIPQYRSSVNQSYIVNSTFETTDYLSTIGEYPYAFISLWDVGTIDIRGNSFKNLNPEAYSFNLRGKGIRTWDADFMVSSETWGPNIFENLYKAVEAENTGSISICNMTDNVFTNNYYGVMLNSVSGLEVISNTFEANWQYAELYMTACDVFHIENNTFTGQNDGYGIWVSDCQGNNEIYRNIFNNLENGITATNDNTGGTTSSGLKLLCNEFNNNLQQIRVINPPGIAFYQGDHFMSAGNRFYPECVGSTSEFDNGGYQINYYEKLDNEYRPDCNINVNIFTPRQINQCLSEIGYQLIPENDFVLLNESIKVTQSELIELTDGGDTESLNETVVNADDNDALILRNELLNESPNLSDTVMINFTSIEDVLPSLMVKEILAANPSAAKSDKVQNALDNRQNLLPVYMREEINLGRSILSHKEELESKLSGFKHEREYLVNRRMIHLMRDTMPESSDTLETLLISENSLNRKYQLVNFYLTKGNTQNAQTVFSTIPQNFELSSKEQNEYDKLSQLFNIQTNLKDANKTWFEMSEVQKAIVTTLAEDSTTRAGMQSRAVLSLVDGIDYGYPMPEIEEGGNKSMNPDPIVYKEIFEVYPQTANDYFITEYALGEKENLKDVKIAVFDNAGKEVINFKIITSANQFLTECEDWKEGTYWCRKFMNNKVTAEEKVVISRSGTVSGNNDKALALYNLEKEKTLEIYPNPAKEYFFISYNLKEIKEKEITLQITDVKGRIIKETTLEKFANQSKISTSSWRKGIYTVSIISGSEMIETVKVVVE